MSQEAEGQVLVDEELDAEQQLRRRLALAQVRQYPDPVLRMRAREVAELDDDLRSLVTRMKQLMQDAHGVGLAATQVGILQRVFVFQRDEDTVQAVVNPTLVELSDEVEADEEGCLSLQGVTVTVERPLRVALEARDESGEPLRLELEGHPARVVQHELDHLEGTLILDRTSDADRKRALAVLRPQPVLTAV